MSHSDWWAESSRAAMRSAIDGTHRFVLVDMDAPMRTCEPMTDGTGRLRLSPDVWRQFMPEECPEYFMMTVPIVYEPQPDEPPFEFRFRWWP